MPYLRISAYTWSIATDMLLFTHHALNGRHSATLGTFCCGPRSLPLFCGNVGTWPHHQIRALFATATVGPKRECPKRPKRPRMSPHAAVEAEEACRRNTIEVVEAQLRYPLGAEFELVEQQAQLVKAEIIARKNILKCYDAGSDDLHIRHAILLRQARKAARSMGEDRRRRNSDDEEEVSHVELASCRHLTRQEQKLRDDIAHAYFDETTTVLQTAESTRRQLLTNLREETYWKLKGLHMIVQQEMTSRQDIIEEEDARTVESTAFSSLFLSLMYSEESSRREIRTNELGGRACALLHHEAETRCELQRQHLVHMLIQVPICESFIRRATIRNAETLATGLFMQHRRRLRQRRRPREPSPTPIPTLSEICSREALFRALITTAESSSSPHLLLHLLAMEKLERRRILLLEGMTRRCTTCKVKRTKSGRDSTSQQETFDSAD